MIDKESITWRLVNWGWCQRGRSGGVMRTKESRRSSPYGGQGYKCMTDVVCNILKEATNGPPPSKTVQSSLNFEDAAKINRAWQKLGIRHQLLLKDLYVLDKRVNAICRELNIKHNPAYHWNNELKAAQEAIQDIVDGGNR